MTLPMILQSYILKAQWYWRNCSANSSTAWRAAINSAATRFALHAKPSTQSKTTSLIGYFMSSHVPAKKKRARHRLRLTLAASALALTTGCATVNHPNPDDPLESYNRTMDKINYNVDHALILPVTNMYKALTPQPAQTCIGNIFNNLGDLWAAVNSFFQGRRSEE